MEGRQSGEPLGRTKGFPKSPPNQRRTTMTTKDLGRSYPYVSSKEVPTPQRLSWKAKLILLAYVAVTPIAMLGWLYLLWLAIVSSLEWMLN